MSLRPPGDSSADLPQVQELRWGGQVREVCVKTTVAQREGLLAEPDISQHDLEVKDCSAPLQMITT